MKRLLYLFWSLQGGLQGLINRLSIMRLLVLMKPGMCHSHILHQLDIYDPAPDHLSYLDTLCIKNFHAFVNNLVRLKALFQCPILYSAGRSQETAATAMQMPGSFASGQCRESSLCNKQSLRKIGKELCSFASSTTSIPTLSTGMHQN